MRKTPSYLKGLAENRARSAGDAQRYAALLEYIAARLADARAEVDAADRLIRKYSSALDPTKIDVIRATKGRYGKHGDFTKTVHDYLREQYPAEVTTVEVAVIARIKYGLDFVGWKDWRHWVRNSVSSRLHALLHEGQVERMHDPTDPCAGVGRWRWVPGPDATVEELGKQASVKGVSVMVADGDADEL